MRWLFESWSQLSEQYALVAWAPAVLLAVSLFLSFFPPREWENSYVRGRRLRGSDEWRYFFGFRLVVLLASYYVLGGSEPTTFGLLFAIFLALPVVVVVLLYDIPRISDCFLSTDAGRPFDLRENLTRRRNERRDRLSEDIPRRGGRTKKEEQSLTADPKGEEQMSDSPETKLSRSKHEQLIALIDSEILKRDESELRVVYGSIRSVPIFLSRTREKGYQMLSGTLPHVHQVYDKELEARVADLFPLGEIPDQPLLSEHPLLATLVSDSRPHMRANAIRSAEDALLRKSANMKNAVADALRIGMKYQQRMYEIVTHDLRWIAAKLAVEDRLIQIQKPLVEGGVLDQRVADTSRSAILEELSRRKGSKFEYQLQRVETYKNSLSHLQGLNKSNQREAENKRKAAADRERRQKQKQQYAARKEREQQEAESRQAAAEEASYEQEQSRRREAKLIREGAAAKFELEIRREASHLPTPLSDDEIHHEVGNRLAAFLADHTQYDLPDPD